MHCFGAGLLVALAACGSDSETTATPIMATETTATETTVDPQHQQWIVYEGPIPGAVGNNLVRPDGGALHAATPSVPLPKDGWQVHPDWSPDGQRLVFAADDADDEGKSRDLIGRDIWISDFEGSNPERVFNCIYPCVEADDPAWSPDGKSVAFVAFDDDNGNAVNVRLALLDVATKKVSTVFVAQGSDAIDWPRWSPDGTHLVVELQHWSNSGSTGEMTASAIAVVDLTAADPAPMAITDWDSWATYPDWNPKDDLIVFSTRQWSELETGPSNLYTIRPDGSEQTALTSFAKGETRAVQPTWTPDGTKIIFTAVEGEGFGNPTMAMIDRDGSDETSATPFPMFGTHPRLRPDPKTEEQK
jgi:Tol biopolymer transport system component